MTEIIKQGFYDAQEGKENPYSRDSLEYKAWEVGFENADIDIEENEGN